MPAADVHDLSSQVRALAEEIAQDLGLYIVEVQVRGQQGSRVVEVFADADAGVGLDQLARLSQDLEFALDADDVIQGRYLLNVSSPGADRPLRLPRQYRRHLGRSLRLTVTRDGEQEVLTGKLVGADDEAIELEIQHQRVRIPLDDVTDARVQLPW